MSVLYETYEPQAQDAKLRFQDQLKASDRVAKNLKNQINDLEDMLKADSSNTKSDIFHKCEHLRASSSIYVAIKKMLRVRDVAIEQRYEEARDDSTEKQQLSETYEKMTEILTMFEDRFTKLLNAPDSWFSVQAVRLKTWLEDNPAAATAVAASCGAAGGVALGAYAQAHGHCLIYYLCSGSACSCSSWGVGASIAIGTGSGLAIGVVIALVVGLSMKYYNYNYASERSSEEVKAINAMVKKMESMSNDQVQRALSELLETSSLAMPADILDPDDRTCVICLGRESEVQTPVRAPRCKGRHFMCKACWVQTLSTHGDKCPVCRI